MEEKIKSLIANKKLTYADLAHELGICEMSARNKVKGKSRFNKLEKEKLLLIINKEEKIDV